MTEPELPAGSDAAHPAPHSPEGSLQPKGSRLTGIGQVAGMTGLAAVVYSLFGYGVIAGLVMLVRLDLGMFTASPFDLLMACWAGVLVGFNALDQVSFWGLVASIYRRWWWAAAAATALLAFGFMLATGKLPGIVEAWLRFKCWAKERPVKNEMRKSAVAFALIIPWLWPPFAAIVGWVVLMVAVSFVMILPLVGYELGKTYALTYVIKPEQCFAPVTRDQFLNERHRSSGGAFCVEIIKDGDQPVVHAGRVVLSTGTYVLLYDPTSGIATRVPIGDRVVRTWTESTGAARPTHASSGAPPSVSTRNVALSPRPTP